VVGEEQANLDRFRDHLLDWVKRGWNPSNLKGILDAFNGVPKTRSLISMFLTTSPARSRPCRATSQRLESASQPAYDPVEKAGQWSFFGIFFFRAWQAPGIFATV
jgi:hypothetical protein